MKIYDDVNLYFATTTIVEWYPVFTEIKYFNLLGDSLNYCIKNKFLNVHAYVFMLNHIHLVVSSSDDNARRISNTMRDFKRFTSKTITNFLKEDFKKFPLSIFRKAASREGRGNTFKVWQNGFYPIAIVTDKFCRQKIRYIHFNPVKKGYVSEPEHWYYSSARNYTGVGDGPIAVECLY